MTDGFSPPRRVNSSATIVTSAREMRKAVAAARRPIGIAVPALIERIGDMPRARDRFRRGAPGMPRLPAAMQQKNRRALVAEHIGDEFVAVRAGEGRGCGSKMLGHGRLVVRKFENTRF